MSDATAISIACILPILCTLIAGLAIAGGIYWFISKRKSREQENMQSTSMPSQTPQPAINTPPQTASPTTNPPPPKAPSSFAPGSVGAASQAAGYDVRDLMMMGLSPQEISSMSKEEIRDVVNGKRTPMQPRSTKKPPTKAAPVPGTITAKPRDKNSIAKPKPVLSEQEIKKLVQGLWVTEDPNESDFRDAIRFAGKYRKECERKLRELGKDAIPYLEPYADREEVASLLVDLKKL